LGDVSLLLGLFILTFTEFEIQLKYLNFERNSTLTARVKVNTL